MNKIRFTDILFSKEKPLGTCISLYCKDSHSLVKGLQEAKKIVAQDHTEEEFRSLFSSLEELRYHWVEYPVAFFVSKNIKGAITLPIDIESVSIVSTSFHVKPLFKMLQRNKKIAVLHFEKKEAQLYLLSFEGVILLDRFSCIKLTDLVSIDRQLSLHLTNIKPLLLLSGDSTLRSCFRTLCHYGPLYTLDYLQPIQKLKRGHVKDIYHLLEPYFLATEKKWIQQLEKASAEGKVEYDFTEIIRMADEGKIKTLYISEEIFDWGNINCKDKTYTRHKTQMDSYDDDLLDDLAEIVFSKNGQIIVLPCERFPSEKTVAGIIRSTTEQYIEYKNRERNTA